MGVGSERTDMNTKHQKKQPGAAAHLSGRRRQRRKSVVAVTREMVHNHSLGVLPLSPGHKALKVLTDESRALALQSFSPKKVEEVAPLANGFLAPAKLRGEMSDCVSSFVAPLPERSQPGWDADAGLPTLGKTGNS